MAIITDTKRNYLTLSNGNSQISVCVHIPAKSNQRKPIGVILFHSLNGCKLGPNDMFPYLADRLSDIGIYCIRFDYAGNGESTWKKDANIESKADDTSSVINYICSKYQLDHICLVSISNSASIVFFLNDTIQKINSIVFLSPIFMHVKALQIPDSMFCIRLKEYGKKMFHKETYKKLINNDIDFKSISMVLRKKNRLENNSSTIRNDKSGTLKNIASIPSLLVIGSRDPHCKKNLINYESFIKKNNLNWYTSILEGSGHNFTNIEDKDKVLHLICEHISKTEEK